MLVSCNLCCALLVLWYTEISLFSNLNDVSGFLVPRDENLLWSFIKTTMVQVTESVQKWRWKALLVCHITVSPSPAEPEAVVCVLRLKLLLTQGGTLVGHPSSACRKTIRWVRAGWRGDLKPSWVSGGSRTGYVLEKTGVGGRGAGKWAKNWWGDWDRIAHNNRKSDWFTVWLTAADGFPDNPSEFWTLAWVVFSTFLL